MSFSLTEIIKEPTWITCSTSTLLDHILTNCSENISQKGVIDVGIPDHQLIYCTRKIKRIKHNMHNQIQVRSLKKHSAKIFDTWCKRWCDYGGSDNKCARHYRCKIIMYWIFVIKTSFDKTGGLFPEIIMSTSQSAFICLK